MTLRFAPWGKLTRGENGKPTALHPLGDHCLDVAWCFVALCESPVVSRALETAAGTSLSPVLFARLAVIVLLHDLGKANAGFQGRFWSSSETRPAGWPGPRGHGEEGWSLILGLLEGEPHLHAVASRLPITEFATWGEAFVPLLQAAISHHGRPIRDPAALHPAPWRVVALPEGASYDPAEAVAALGKLAC